MTTPVAVSSRDNPSLVRIRKLLSDPGATRKLGWLWLEGDHLIRAALTRGVTLAEVLVDAARADDALLQPLLAAAPRASLVDSRLWRELSGLETPTPIGALVALPTAATIEPGLATVVLDRLQDAGNAGSILRSASALGVRQVVALKGTVSLWSPKVLRAGMGAHFNLRLVEAQAPDALDALAVPWVGTSSHADALLHEAQLPQPCAWFFGHEGRGVDEALLARCAMRVAIAQDGGEESLNVAAAAAICLHESQRQSRRLARP